ncbi:MAG TPA: DUF3617 family protein [Vicinamibacterales bacterium]|jgi:hypothetical protein|nr:DUF3617 family protein [Vicinamibacterales bacterium]
MKLRFGSMVLLALGLSWTVTAQSSSPMREGLWEVNTKMNIPGMAEMPPMKHQQCITAAMIKDPVSAIPKMNDCKVSNYKLQDNTATYTVTCTQPAEVTANGEIKYSGSDAYTGTLTLLGQGMTYVLTYDAKRIGDCSK